MVDENDAREARRHGRGSPLVLLVALLLAAAQGFAAGRTTRQEGAGSSAPPAAQPARPRLVVRTGHTTYISSVTFSPDGRTVLTGSGDHTARLWDVETGAELRSFEGHGSELRAVAYLPDGRAVATASADGSVRVWDTATGAELRRLSNPPRDCQAIAVSPGGRVAVGGSGGVQVWDAATGAELRRIPSPSPAAVALSPDGRLLAIAARNKAAYLWSIDTGAELHRFAGHVGPVASVAFSPDGQFVVTGDSGLSIKVGTKRGWSSKGARLWNVATGSEVRSFVAQAKLNPLGVAVVAFSPDGRVLMTACKVDRTVRLWDSATGKQLRSFVAHEGGDVHTAAFSPDGRTILTASQAHLPVRLWDAETMTLLRRFRGAGVDGSIAASCSRDGRFVLTGVPSKDAVRLWDTAAGGIVATFENPGVDYVSAELSPDGRLVLIGSKDGIVRVKDRASGVDLRRLEGHSDAVHSIAFSPDGRTALTASRDETARLWDLATGAEVRRFKGHTSPRFPASSSRGISEAVLSPDGRLVMMTGADYKAVVWNAETGERVFEWEQPHWVRLGFAPDSRAIVVGGYSVEPRLLDLAGTELRRLPLAGIVSLAYSPDGRLLALGDRENGVRLLDAATGAELRRFVGHSERVWSIAFSADGRLLITGSLDSTTRFWEVATGRELCRLLSFENGTWVVVDPEGRFDTNDLEQAGHLHWTLPDEPFRALPLELFMRDYYEPRLLARLLAGERLAPVRPIAEVNPLRPTVRILDAHREPDAPDHVTVRVEVTGIAEQVRQGGAMVLRRSGAYDLRLFRDGQMVAYAPRTPDVSGARDEGLDAWRRDTRIALDPTTGSSIVTFRGIPVPRTAGVTQGELSAYAFNEDRIKSATDVRAYAVPADLTPISGRVYLVTIGVNASQNARLDLRYAASDARSIRAALPSALRQAGQYGEVVAVSLISDRAGGSGDEAPATKANIRAVVDRLAGRAVAPAVVAGIPNAERLRRARPEDLVILSFSGHGYADSRGEFFLAPHDVGAGPLAEALARCVSSEELSLWLRDVDAGEMVLVIDACHSAALVEREGFKPGPMGSRGLGQLAYDKRMRVLAATQVDNVALESERVRQGLLTYALMRDGIGARSADFKPKDGKITLAEWLGYAVERVPELYEEIRLGKRRDIVHANPEAPTAERPELKTQRPALFDFSRARREIVLAP